MPIVPEETESDLEMDDWINWNQAPGLALNWDDGSALPDAANGLNFELFTANAAPTDPSLDFLDQFLTPNHMLVPLPQDQLPTDVHDHAEDSCFHCKENAYHCKRIREGTHIGSCTSCVALSLDCNKPMMPMPRHTSSSSEDLSIPTTQALTTTTTTTTNHSQPAKAGARLDKQAVCVLKKWFASHIKHPYPNEEEKEHLQRLTNLNKTQITNWLANYRRRNKISHVRSASPNVNNLSMAPVDIPQRRATPSPMDRRPLYETMNPLERWQISPPENEPASITAINRAISSTSSSMSFGLPSPLSLNYVDDGSSRSLGHGSSASSLPTSHSSGGSHGSAYSYSSRNSLGSLHSLDRGRRRRRRHVMPKMSDRSTIENSLTMAANTYQCTFCPQTFKTKYDWQRHEKSLHLSLETWVCGPKGAKAFNPQTKQIECVFCSEPNPTAEHLEAQHNVSSCHEKEPSQRIYYRRDHLRQHLRLVHQAKFMPWSMSGWEQRHENVTSKCGFCGLLMQTWAKRVDHLAEHFKNGSTMADWKGDWGFVPEVLNQVQGAIPPYLIHEERLTPLPFSATRHIPETPIHAYNLLKTELAYWARNFVEVSHKDPTVEELQHEACRVIFGAEVISRSGPASKPSWLRDLLMSNSDIAMKAQLGPIRGEEDSWLSVLKINGKDNVFDGCPLERQLQDYVTSRIMLGLTATDRELQVEACQILGRFEESSSAPSELIGNMLVQLVNGSTTWLAPFRQRAHLPRSEEMAEEDCRPKDGSLDSTIHNFSRLERELSDYVRTQRSFNMEPDDADLQRKARWIIYEYEDGWNQTAADNPEWLAGFRRRHAAADAEAARDFHPSIGNLFKPRGSRRSVPRETPAHGSSSAAPLATDGGASFPTSTAAPDKSSKEVWSNPNFFWDMNCYRRLERELSRWVRGVMSPQNPNYHVPSDEELQHQARWIVFDDDDPWNSTAADNVEWLQRFKRDNGLVVEPGPGLPNCDTWAVQQGGTGFAPPYCYPKASAPAEPADGAVQISLRDGAKMFEVDPRAVDKFLQGMKTRYPAPAAVFCSRELESGLSELIQASIAASGIFPDDETLRSKAREILGTETTAADDGVLLGKFKDMMRQSASVGLGEEAGVLVDTTDSGMTGMELELDLGLASGTLDDEQMDAILRDMDLEVVGQAVGGMGSPSEVFRSFA